MSNAALYTQDRCDFSREECMNKDRDMQELQSELTATCKTGHQPVAMDTDDRGNPNGENNRQL